MWNPFKKKEKKEEKKGRAIGDLKIYRAEEESEEDRDKAVQKAMDIIKASKFGHNIIAAQINEQIKRRTVYEIENGRDIIVECKYAAPLPMQDGSIIPGEYVFYGDPTRVPFDIKKVRKIFKEEIEKIKKYYPEIKTRIGFVKEGK